MFSEISIVRLLTLPGCHNERNGVSNHRRPNCLRDRLVRSRSKKTSKLRLNGFCDWNSRWIPRTHRASNAENVSIWWRHHGSFLGAPRLDYLPHWQCIDTLRPRQNGRHFADEMFKCIFVNENVWIPIEISLKFVPKGSINNNPALFQIMAWRRPGDKPLSETMMVSSLTHICVTRPQWVNYCSRRISTDLASTSDWLLYIKTSNWLQRFGIVQSDWVNCAINTIDVTLQHFRYAQTGLRHYDDAVVDVLETNGSPGLQKPSWWLEYD